MTISNRSPVTPGISAPRGEDAARRVELARAWAHLLSTTDFLPLQYTELERRLLELLDRLDATLAAEPFSARPAGEIGAALVELHCTGRAGLRGTVEMLGAYLLDRAGAENQPDRVLALLAALVSGYADAQRAAVLAQQETVVESVLTSMRELARGRDEFEELFARSTSGVAILATDGTFQRVNPALCRQLDRPAEDFATLSLFDVLFADDVMPVRQVFHDLVEQGMASYPQRRRLVRPDGEVVLTGLVLSVLERETGSAARYLAIFDDVTELALLQGRLSHQSLHDMLTGLPNRQFFTTYLEKVLRRADPDTGVTVYHLDLDAFSVISDGLGRPVGDRLLREVADRLRTAFAGERAMISRFGTDEFGVIVENGQDTPDVVRTIGRINEALAEPAYVDGHGVAASATVGVVHRPPSDADPHEVLRAADVTLRRARSIGHRQWELFDAGQDARDRELLALAADMPGAFENGEVRAVYQPVIRLEDDRVAGVEALLHWENPGHGVLRHEACVGLAERTGLSLPLGTWLMAQGCRRAPDWHPVPVSLGLTAHQSHDPDLVKGVLRVLAETGAPAGALRLGFPLRALMAEQGEAAENLRVLADVGVGTMVHDFAGGPMDLGYLEDLPAEGVRFSRRLVDLMPAGDGRFAAGAAVLDAVRTVRSAGLSVVVDGITSAEQAKWWRAAGADLALGAFYGPAGPAAGVDDLLARNRPARQLGVFRKSRDNSPT